MGPRLQRLRDFCVAWWPLMLPVYLSLMAGLAYVAFMAGALAMAMLMGWA